MKVAIVHYWLVTMRGGEKVLETLLEMFPDADIYTHVYDPDAVSDLINSHRVYTSYINYLPLAKKLYQKYMPFMPRALNKFNLQEYDLIISSESGPAKGVVPNPDAFHICYCHSPMRYLWDMYHEYLRDSNFLVRFLMRRMIPSLRVWDVTSSNLVDHFAANSNYVAKRIRRYYNRGSDVVFPPVAIERFLPVQRNPEDFYLFFGQLVGYKRADIAINACIASGRKLVVLGAGARKKDIREYEQSGLVTFVGRVSDDDIADYFSRAKALLFPGIEDFGIIPVEANAAGCPVIAYRKGGVLDTVKENVTGLFFEEQTPMSLIKAMDAFESMEPRFQDREQFAAHVQQFSKDEFIRRMNSIIEERRRV
ncbi:glycosyltransferase [Breznakiella homolactica]|uniref:Glycosyltransferase n=1 Tax=Breznakiella homolactica TaxID=2798577 RepID=A0A7T7XP31_9SPIR|nr:glycosyltransferase [Breznakiella homolactica]QQO09793.1 glycosyltransferase [Breznakiella homolactica]